MGEDGRFGGVFFEVERALVREERSPLGKVKKEGRRKYVLGNRLWQVERI